MAFSISFKHLRLSLAVLYIIFSHGKSGKAEDTPQETAAAGVLEYEYLPGQGLVNHDDPKTGTLDDDPDHLVAKALLCFDEKKIYSYCEEDYRLSASGFLHVPYEHTDEYCHGPCVSETYLVLDCIDGVLSHFKFYNKATIDDVKDTIKSGCSYGPKRGDFDVAEHIHEEEDSNAHKICSSLFLSGLLLMIMSCRLWL